MISIFKFYRIGFGFLFIFSFLPMESVNKEITGAISSTTFFCSFFCSSFSIEESVSDLRDEKPALLPRW